MPYVRLKVQPYEVIDVDERNRYLVRFADGTTMRLERDEFFVLIRLNPNWTNQLILDGREQKVIDTLVKYGVATVSDNVKPLFTFTLKVSKGCNLACKYCYEWAHPEKISMHQREEVVIRTLETFLKYGDIHPIWHGGEPTLFFESLIEPIMEKYGTMGGRIRWSLQSNGVRFSDKNFVKRYARIAKLYDLGTGISIDGFKDDNFMRVFPDGTPAWEYTVQGIQNLIEAGLRPGTIVVVNNRSVKHLPEIVEWLHSLGVKGTRLNPLYPAGHEEIIKIAPSAEEYSEGLVKAAKKVIKLNTENGSIERRITITNVIEALTSMFNSPSSICWRNVCGAGSVFYSIQYDGTVWACDHLSIKLGNVLDGWHPYVPRSEDMLRFWEEQALHFQPLFGYSRCAHCPYRQYCNGGGCYAFIQDMYGEDAYRKEPPYCPFKLFQFLDKLIKEERDYEIAALAPDYLYKYWYLGVMN